MTDTLHLIEVLDRRPSQAPRFECSTFCSGPVPHISEYRAPTIRPTPAQTAAFKALDARRSDVEEATAG